ncbi:MAG: type II secretion system protein [Sulfurovaceae bacterium]|nr:type II secretion system protein [Sulfurovaceae bacterium]MDD5549497.1 type II secretion system protein [Sulfurovaceae bacterium]
MRQAFSMITAIFVILILATIAMLSLNMVANITKTTTIQYRKEQAQLYAKSYTELAIMAITQYDRAANNNCVNTINGDIGTFADGSGYRVATSISYIGGTGLPAGCTMPTGPYVASLAATNSVAAAIIDVTVSYMDTSTSTSPIVYHMRTMQKI